MNNPLIFDDTGIRKLPEDERLIQCEKIINMKKMNPCVGMQCGWQVKLSHLQT